MDGVSKDELGSFMKNLVQFPSRDELNTMLKEIDIDGRWRYRWVCQYSSPQRARSSPCYRHGGLVVKASAS